MTGLVASLPTLEQGFECSDMDSFFSSVTGGFQNHVHPDGDGVRVEMAHGAFRLRTLAQPGVLRHDVEIVRPAWLYDVVARWVLPGRCAPGGRVGGEPVPYGSELYHEHPVTELELGGTRIGMVGATTLPANLRAAMYLRCEAGNWIVHARAVAGIGARPFLKRTDGTSLPFAGSLLEERVLARRREVAAPIYQSQVQPHVLLAAGTRFTIGLEAR